MVARRYRTVTIPAGRHTLAALEPVPDDLAKSTHLPVRTNEQITVATGGVRFEFDAASNSY